jgi:hypothetical protein
MGMKNTNMENKIDTKTDKKNNADHEEKTYHDPICDMNFATKKEYDAHMQEYKEYHEKHRIMPSEKIAPEN